MTLTESMDLLASAADLAQAVIIILLLFKVDALKKQIASMK